MPTTRAQRALRAYLRAPVLLALAAACLLVGRPAALSAPAVEEVDVLPVALEVAPAPTLVQRPPRWVTPLAGGYRMTGTFGASGSLWSSSHTGLDLATGSGTPIRSVGAGRVTSAGYDGAYGNTTVVTLRDGTEVWYSHQSTLVASVGQRVRPGHLLGHVGTTGNVTGAHLHLEIRPGGGTAVDPEPWLAERGLL